MKELTKIADIHCHAIPGVDDGAQTFEDSLAILESEYDQGVRLIVTTPHYRKGWFETDRKIVRKQFLYLKDKAHIKFPDLQLLLGCEFHANIDMINQIESDDAFRMNGTDYVLTEFSAFDDQNYIRQIINLEITSGYIPIIAHIERYQACVDNLDFIFDLKHMGALMQINADALIGKNGRRVSRYVFKLMKENLVDFVGSDVHNVTDRNCHLQECERMLLRKKIYQSSIEKIMWENANECFLNHDM